MRARTGWWRVAVAVAARPRLWGTALRQARRLARRGWWHRPPLLPVPGGDYLSFRLETQYGAGLHPARVSDVVNYLSWCRRIDQLRRGDPGS